MSENCCMAHDGFDIRLGKAEENIEKLDKWVEGVDNRVTKLEKDTALDTQRLTIILENVSVSLPKLATAIENVEKTMVSMQSEIRESNKKTDDIQIKLSDLDRKVCAIDEDGKFNIREYIKKNFPTIIVASSLLGGGAALGSWLL